MDIGLRKTDVAALNIGTSSSANTSVIVSERMATLAAQAAGDIKINGKDAFATDFDPTSTPVDGVDDHVGAAVDGQAANNGQFGTLGLAAKINTNTGEHGVADAFNIVRAQTTSYIAKSFAINGVTVRSRATKEEWVAAVSESTSC